MVRQMGADGLVLRKVFPVIPPRVEDYKASQDFQERSTQVASSIPFTIRAGRQATLTSAVTGKWKTVRGMALPHVDCDAASSETVTIICRSQFGTSCRFAPDTFLSSVPNRMYPIPMNDELDWRDLSRDRLERPESAGFPGHV
jgi:hypothetical protein